MFEKGGIVLFGRMKKNNSKPVEQEQKDLLKEDLIKVMDKLVKGKVAHLDEAKYVDRELAAAWNKLADSVSEEKRHYILSINNIVMSAIKMDLVRDLIGNMRKHDKSISVIAEQVRRMVASIEEVAKRVETVAENLENASHVANEGKDTINKAFSFVDDSFSSIDDIGEQINGILTSTEQIVSIIDVIKRIARKTNLVALNATIEAARAGEHGRGFSVVASEVSKLADNTGELVTKIEDNIGELSVAVEKSVDDMNQTAKQLRDGKAMVDEALSSLARINDAIGTVNAEVVGITEDNKEQTQASREIVVETKYLTEIHEQSNEIGRIIFVLNTELSDVRAEMTEHVSFLSKSDMIDLYIVDHLLWRWYIYNMFLGYEKDSHKHIPDHKECRLGEWYYSEKNPKLKSDKTFQLIEEPHIKLHKDAKEVALAYGAGDTEKVEQLLNEMEENSKKIVDYLLILKEKLK